MKNLIAGLALLFIASVGIQAQNTAANSLAQQATEKYTQLYGLDEKQQADMLEIQERKLRNLAEIEPLKASDPTGYTLKLRSVQGGNHASIQRLLNEEQIKLFRQEQQRLREEKSNSYKVLKASGASQQEIERKMIEYDLQTM
ncbi:MAG: hypothetical protein IPN76_31565 [Saprospiraceae bacterium]|nr:hypothetical protein [Saprospiraceae bacterium]